MVTSAVALSIAVGTGFATADSLADPGGGLTAPSRALGPQGSEERGSETGHGTRGQPGREQGPHGSQSPSRQGQSPQQPHPNGIGGTQGTVETLPGLGPATLARVPRQSRQVVLATSDDADSFRTTIRLWTRTADGRWRTGRTWHGHNGLRGWSRRHVAGDLRSPVGVFSLTAAGGLAGDPGTALPYYRSSGFAIDGTGFHGEQLEGTFDYVVAIDYNRRPGTSPLDPAKPMGDSRGGGIWLHVDHGGPTQGCVTLAERDLITLMRTLSPAARPVIVMGDRQSLAR